MKKLETVLKSQGLSDQLSPDAKKTSRALIDKPLRGASQKCVGSAGQAGCG